MRIADLMTHTWAYRAWQAPFAGSKLRPLLARTDFSRVRRVLDVGCGPGTNAPVFERVAYTGVDINRGYIADARRRHGRDFRVVDVTNLGSETLEPADFILVNSLLHHLDTDQVHKTLGSLPPLLTEHGSVHILDLVLPPQWSMARVMARLDRGRYPRPEDQWRTLFNTHFTEQVFEPYMFGGGLWSMVYYRGSRRR